MSEGFFFTGFPGFLCQALMRKIITTTEGKCTIYALVLPQMMEKAEEVKDEIRTEFHLEEDQIVLVTGDITKENLDIPPHVEEAFIGEVGFVYHLAALYDLAVPRQLAYEINVTGTKNVNEWVRTVPNLKRYTYFSTAYVAGKREGTLYETEIVFPNGFKNYYEETKYEAELLVESLKKSVPTTIIRPGIVKGHSETGETIKFDGPYFILNFLDRLRFMPVIPFLSKSDAVINLVPVDYLIDATIYLSMHEKGVGKTYHLTDPNPYKVTAIYEMMMEELLQKAPKGTLPLPLARAGLQSKWVRTYLGVEKEALDYFTWRGTFNCAQTVADLAETNIRCPDFKDGLPAMVAFYLRHKNNKNYHVKIL